MLGVTITVRAGEPIVKGAKFRSMVPAIKPALDVLQAFLISIFCCFFDTSAGFGRWMCSTPLSNFASTFAGSGSNGRGIARLNEP